MTVSADSDVDGDASELAIVVRTHWGHVLSALVASVRDFELAEDALQDAVVVALEKWKDEPPRNAAAWLYKVAKRKALDRIRRDKNYSEKREQYFVLQSINEQIVDDADEDSAMIPDERLRLIFTCCHPALAQPAQIALTLRNLGGLSTREIASAFLVPELTMAQRISRAKRKIKTANIPYKVPASEELAERLNSVLAVIYLIFNEGYKTTSGDQLTRSDLTEEAIFIAGVLTRLLPEENEVKGLLALMLLHDSRRQARTSQDGALMTLENQDRSIWDQAKIQAGITLLNQTFSCNGCDNSSSLGFYQLQAAISATHAQALSYAATDWNQIAALYEHLFALQASSVIKLNSIVALSYAQSVDVALQALQGLEDASELKNYQPFYATKADLLRRAGQHNQAKKAYQHAIALSDNAAEKRFLNERSLQLESG